tara:strand:+ start:397 stop:681 length:285 start_codon:yes stop_codon:yes gene_type:complete
MNLREAKRLKPGAIVRQAWAPNNISQGIVLSKEYVKGAHKAEILGGTKQERYDIEVHWVINPPSVWDYVEHRFSEKRNLQTHQNWELMVIQHVK